MTMSTHRESARIYAFVPKARMTAGGSRQDGSSRQDGGSTDPRSGALPRCEFGSGWYHDAAVREDAQARGTPRLTLV